MDEKLEEIEKKIGSNFKVLAEGWCKDKVGRLEYFAPDAPKSCGLIIPEARTPVWFRPDQIKEE